MNNLLFAIIVNGVVLTIWLVIFLKDKEKGLKAIKVGLQTILSILPILLIMVGLIGLFSSFINPSDIAKYLGEQAGISGFLFVALFSSFLQIPGIVAFPIAATLFKSGAAVSIVSLFACAATMASVFTLPLEMKFLGKKLPIIRIGLTVIVSIIVGLLTGILFHLVT